MAKPLTLPALICGTSTVSVSKARLTSPPSSAVTAGALPLNGTCSSLTPASPAKYSPARWVIVVLPDEEKVTTPGLALARVTASFSVAAGKFGAAAMVMAV